MVLRTYVLVSLILSSCSLENGVKIYINDSEGYRGISESWDIPCAKTWSLTGDKERFLATCFPKIPEEVNCTATSLSYNVREAKELFVIITTETRRCTGVENPRSCTGKFSLSVNYSISESNSKRVILPDEIPKKVFKKDANFFHTNDTVSFSVNQNYKNLKLGFQAPFYCGSVKTVSVYYYLCPAKTNALVDFPEKPAPDKISSPYIFVGTCTKNAVKESDSHDLLMKCYYNGTAEVFGGCECEAGYTKKKNLCKG